MPQLELPPKEEKVCANCKHLAWLIALGQGLRCTHKSVYQADFNVMPPTVPSSRHTCENFQSRHEDEKDSASSHI